MCGGWVYTDAPGRDGRTSCKGNDFYLCSAIYSEKIKNKKIKILFELLGENAEIGAIESLFFFFQR